jgi:hypothetical protein
MSVISWLSNDVAHAIPSYHAHSNGLVLIYNCAITLSWRVDTSFMACLMYGNHIILDLDNLAERMSKPSTRRAEARERIFAFDH